MYARKRTWLERGPAPAVRCGLGTVNLFPAPPDQGGPMVSWGDQIGDWYETLVYGHIPRAGELPAPPAPGVPAGALVPSSGDIVTPGLTPAQQAAYVASQQAALDAAVSSGSWNPAGNLPVTADDIDQAFKDHSTAIIIGVCAVAAIALFAVGKGRR